MAVKASTGRLHPISDSARLARERMADRLEVPGRRRRMATPRPIEPAQQLGHQRVIKVWSGCSAKMPFR
jgi:hypothetical protein